MEAGQPVQAADVRLTWLKARLSKALGDVGKAEKVSKAFDSTEAVERFMEFLESPNVRALTVFGDTLTVSTGLPKKMAKGQRAVYVLKPGAGCVRTDDPGSDMLVGDLSGEPLEHLERVLREVYVPLLSNTSNAPGLGESAARELNDRLHGLLAHTAITVSQARGDTLLPLPPLDATTVAPLSMRDRIRVLEAAVLTWQKQINALLAQEPDEALRAGRNPHPSSEIAFWKDRSARLSSICGQLTGEPARRVLHFLDACASPLCTPFARLCREVLEGREAAEDNAKYLGALEGPLAKLASCNDFEGLPSQFPPLMHMLLLVWRHSAHYNTPGRLAVLLRQIANAIISQARAFVSGKAVFELIAEEQAASAVAKLQATYAVCDRFKQAFRATKARAGIECPDRPWRINNGVLFGHLDVFMERLHDVTEMASAVTQYGRLERVVVGGAKGAALTSSIEHIHAEYRAALAAFEAVPYDLLDIDGEGPDGAGLAKGADAFAVASAAQGAFKADFRAFCARLRGLDRRLAAVLTSGLEDAANVYARFKLLDAFDGLLGRPPVADVLGHHHQELIALYANDLRRVQEVFLTQRDDPPIGANLPPIAGALYWCRSLRARVSEPIGRVRALARDGVPALGEETREALAAHATLAASLDDYERGKIAEWGGDVERSSSEKLRQPLLVRGPRKLDKRAGGAAGAVSNAGSSQAVQQAAVATVDPRSLTVNFDPALVRLLREVKYFLFLGLTVPAPALSVYAKAETYRRQTGHLDAIAGMYNSMMGELLPVEVPLLKPHMRRVDAVLAQGIRDLDWTSPHIDTFISEAQGVVKAAYDTLGQLKGNLREILGELEGWSRDPLFSRKSKPMGPDEFEAHFKQLRSARFGAITEGGKAIERRLKESAGVLKIGAKPAPPAGGSGAGQLMSPGGAAAASNALAAAAAAHWGGYVDFVSGIVVQGLARLASVSLRKLVETLSPPPDRARPGGGDLPLLSIDLVLDAARGGVRFVPEVALPGVDDDSDGSGGGCGGFAGTSIAASGGPGTHGSVAGIVGGWVNAFLHASTVFPRLDDPSGRYLKDVLDDVEVQILMAQLHEVMARSDAACADFRGSYQAYAYLWTSNTDEAFAAFCEGSYVELPKSQDQVKAEAAAAAAAGASSSSAAAGGGEGGADEGVPQPRVPDLERFDAEIVRYRDLADEVSGLKTPTDLGWLRVNSAPAKTALLAAVNAWQHRFTSHLASFVCDSVGDMQAFIAHTLAGLEEELATLPTPGAAAPEDKHDAAGAAAAPAHPAPAAQPTQAALKRCMGFIRGVRQTRYVRKALVGPLRRAVSLLKKHGVSVDDMRITVPPPTDAAGAPVGESTSLPLAEALEGIDLRLEAVINQTFARKEAIFPFQTAEMERIRRAAESFTDGVRDFWNGFRKGAPFAFGGSPDEAYAQLDGYHAQLVTIASQAAELNTVEELFELPTSRFPELAQCRAQLRALKTLWDFKSLVLATYDAWKGALWAAIDTEALEDANRKVAGELKRVGDAYPTAKAWGTYRDVESLVRDMSTTLPLVNELHSPAMRPRHWKELAGVCGVKALDPSDAKFSLEDLLDLRLHTHAERVSEIVDAANKEQKIERKMDEVEAAWRGASLEYVPHKDSDVRVVRASDEIMENLDAHALELQGIVSMGRVMEFFRGRVEASQRSLGTVEEVLREWLGVTKAWASLESIFLGSADIRAQLPDDTKRFEGIDGAFKEMMKAAQETPNVVEACTKDGRGEALRDMTRNLELCQKSLNEYLDTKKKIFPRFYFVSNVALLDILSNGNNPPRVMPYVGDSFDSIADVRFEPPAVEGGVRNTATAMISKDGEVVPFHKPFVMTGAVERWLNELTTMQQDSLRYILEAAIESAVNWEAEKPRHMWLEDYPAQIALVGSQIYWTEETQAALDELEAGQEDSLKKYLAVCNDRLNALIARVMGDLPPDLRTKIISLITLDVHARDVVQKLIDSKAEGPSSFLWSQQLRFYWAAETRDVNIAITDFRSKYSYEYLGNSGRLVITPLTDRCYITLTMALRLFLGGAPAGPAGTGKTETTKDLARALALPCYVFNCSDQMNYQTMADIFKGLSQTGAWGCFDEFNRINIEVLSVVATQVKSILDACVLLSNPAARPEAYQSAPAGSPPCVVGQFELAGDTINLIPTVGLFITMNPGYAGRTELPENLKALFRSCAMIRPDLALICENMLMSEGFQSARPLSIKFVTLYQLCSELLSPQAHYDWGLRAIKSVLRVAGALKRADPEIEEEGILMRALRDFNTPKLPTADLPIFLRLIQDLFPRYYQMSTKMDADLAKLVTQACREAKPLPLQADQGFVAKVVQLQELLDVRHSVMLVGPAGCGKTTVWKTLAAAHNLGKPKNKHSTIYEVVDPKAVTSNELYGYMTLSKEWKDGVLSIIMRGMSKNVKELGYHPHQSMKWVVLDGDIDAVWIESMNTVMDDNKMLTLVSNERIPLSASMRMVFEVNSLANATPATVSRAGILFINDTDIGWRPYVETWMGGLDNDAVKAHLPGLFDKYIEPLAEGVRRMKSAVPLPLINQVMSVCRLMDPFLESLPAEPRKPLVEILEHLFATAAMWAFGGALTIEAAEDGSQRGNHRLAFHSLLTDVAGGAFKLPKDAPEGSLVFDWFFNPQSEELEHWSTRVPTYAPVPIGNAPGQTPFSFLMVPTVDSTRLSYLMGLLIKRGHPVMFAGTTGTGKSTLVRSHLASLDESTLSATVTMNYYMDSVALQARVDGSVEKRTGRLYGPPQGKKLLLFVDDMNLPYVETYGTQNALSLLRQVMDLRSYYDRSDLGMRKELADVQVVGALNPTAGSFTITERLQRLFTAFACLMPSDGDLALIFKSILSGHLTPFAPDVRGLAEVVTDASIRLHKAVSSEFLPDAERFMYVWSMRELGNVFQGLCTSRPELYPTPGKLVRLWAHEARRVFSDRMVDEADAFRFDGRLKSVCKAVFKDVEQEAVFAEPLIFTSFAGQPGGGDPAYLSLPAGEAGMGVLGRTLADKLEEYNSSHSIMELVLFQQAMEHVSRIARIIANPAGNALLIGVGGSGKQSLSRLAAHICGYDVRQLAVTSRFTVADLKDALKEMYRTAGVKGQGLVFLLTDSQIVNDQFLVYVNDLLASGWIADLFERDELDAIYGSLRNEAKAAGVLVDSVDEMHGFFLGRVRANLHVVLCFSPVGEAFRVRARRFPALTNATSIDRFHAWPKDALISVASRFLADVDLGTDEVKTSVALHMAEAHMSVTGASADFRERVRRHNYVTPKSFLELIAFYKHLLAQKRTASGAQIRRLDDGLAKLRQTAEDVANLKVDVQRAMAKAEDEVRNTDALVAQMSAQREVAQQEKDAAAVVAERAKAASDAAGLVEAEASGALAEAKPALDAARAAVAGLDKNSLTELKNFKSPPKGIEKVTACCLMMIEGEFKNQEKWDRAKKMMGDVTTFLNSLQQYDARSMSEELIAKLEPYVKDEGFTYENMKAKSSAAANLCSFVANIYKYNRIYVNVKPLMDALEKAQGDRQAAQSELDTASAKVAKIEAALHELEQTLAEATAKKQAAEAEAARCSERLSLANRLVNGLASENERWGIEVGRLKESETLLIGDVLLASAFVSYIGAFNASFRRRLWSETWVPDIRARGIPCSSDPDPLALLTDEGRTAKMLSEGLPADRISIENGAIINASKRWPLIIDPQLQGIKWLKKKAAAAAAAAAAPAAPPAGGDSDDKPAAAPSAPHSSLVVLTLTQPNWLKQLTSAIQAGSTVIMENCGEELDATLDPVLSRAVYSRGRTLYLRLGGEEVEYDPRFKLYLQTKLPNPHYRPEVQAQTSVINFIATEAGLTDQLLARVVNEEKAELEGRKQALADAFNSYKMQLIALEDELLNRLANAPDDILSDVALIEGLEATKRASSEITAAVAKGRETEKEINAARQVYVPVAEEGAMLYFTVSQLCGMEHMYQYSLDAFMLYFYKAIREAPSSEDIRARVEALRDTLRLVMFRWVSRGLSERHKLILLCQLTFQLLARGKLRDCADEWSAPAFQFLLRGPKKLGDALPASLEWLPEPAWFALQALAELEGGEFAKLPSDLAEAPSRFRDWFTSVAPESEKLPLDWAALDKTPLKKLLVLRCMRPDRLNSALKDYCAATLPGGSRFTECDGTLNSGAILEDSLRDSAPWVPLFYILSPGADVVADVDKLARKAGLEKGVSYHNVSMGQGQDVVANAALDAGAKQGHWVLLNNVHLMPRWLVEVEKKLDALAAPGGGAHEKFRVFLTAEPSPAIPIGILNRSIKLTQEPPQGLKANLKRALCLFPPEQVNDMDSKQRSILFGLCYFHAVMVERKKFGPKGFNMMYPFSLGDLRDSAICLTNYMEASAGAGKIPWEDLRYIFGQIIYGGHIVNDFDRLLCGTYLEHFLRDELLDEMELYPFVKDEKGVSFRAPSATTFDRYLEHVESELRTETPVAFGLHPNAEIGFRTELSEGLLRTLLELQPRDAESGGGGDVKTPRELAQAVMSDVLDAFGETSWDPDEVAAGLEEVGPFQNVLLLELKQMNRLLGAMKSSLIALRMGFEGKLTMSESMERLETELALDKVPVSWAKLAWPSLRSLAAWRHNLATRVAQLNEWVTAPAEPLKVTWLSGLINPQSFLTAIRQQAAQRHGLELDKLVIATEVTKKRPDEIEAASRDGCYISGLFLQGARFDAASGQVERSRPREMYSEMPVINVRAVPADKLEGEKGVFHCPIYKTEQRGPTFICLAQLRTKSPAARWVMGGASLILDVAL